MIAVARALGTDKVRGKLTKSASLLSVATAVPPHVMVQKEVAALAHAVFGDRYPGFDRLARVFETSGIRTRYAVRPADWYLSEPGWPERTAAYLEGADALFARVAKDALEMAGVAAEQVDTIVTISSTGIATPSLEARALSRIGFRTDVARVPIFGLGCAGGVSGFSVAARLAESRPGTNVLLVVIELCTLASRPDSITKANIVATALFGDGAAACVLRAGDGGLAKIEAAGEYTWPETLDLMGWDVDPQGFGVIFARAIPPFVEANLRVAVNDVLERHSLALGDVDRFVCHPGGAKVVTALERALSLPQGSLDHEREVLATYGNMSAPTVFFVLDRVLKQGLPSRAVLSALGPGFTASLLSLKRAA
ncbi:MAG: type III polyketide synthase [Hyphomicrobiales bacterium]|nr:type III polyketide synthase [Hyphomicrobiales bacterium]MBV9590311.1 type III polyketide synthase [Hyphomicrobiales bacterium]